MSSGPSRGSSTNSWAVSSNQYDAQGISKELSTNLEEETSPGSENAIVRYASIGIGIEETSSGAEPGLDGDRTPGKATLRLARNEKLDRGRAIVVHSVGGALCRSQGHQSSEKGGGGGFSESHCDGTELEGGGGSKLRRRTWNPDAFYRPHSLTSGPDLSNA